MARTLSPLIGGFFADKYQKFKLIATIGYIAVKNSGFIDARWATPDQQMANFQANGQDFFKSAIGQSLWKNGVDPSSNLVIHDFMIVEIAEWLWPVTKIVNSE